MNIPQLSLFENITIFQNRRICITGENGLDKKRLKQILLDMGAKRVDYNIYTKDTHYIVCGETPNEETMKRRILYQHDGFYAKVLTTDDLAQIFAGNTLGYETEDVVKKRLHLTKEHYYWTPPSPGTKKKEDKEGEETTTIRTSSPLDYHSAINPIIGKEIFVPDMEGKDTNILRQIVGNLGAYANRELFPETQLIMLSNRSYEALMRGMCDPVLQLIEETYNASDANIFNIPFTYEDAFFTWLINSPWKDECANLVHKYTQIAGLDKGLNMRSISNPLYRKTNMEKKHLPSTPVSFVAIDFETATRKRDSICQIGITEVVDGKILDPKCWLVQPEGNKYEAMNIRVHGITAEMTKNSPTFKEVWPEIYPLLQHKIVVAHNTSFDMYALRDSLLRDGLVFPTFDYYCSRRISQYIIKGVYSYRLDVLLDFLDIPFGNHHQANYDAQGCAQLILKCLEQYGGSFEDLENDFHFQRGQFAPNVFISQHTKNRSPKYVPLNEKLDFHPEKRDENNYFYGKTICFTGKCQYGNRKEMQQMVYDIGANPQNGVTKETDVLVVGQQDYRVVGEEGMSEKQVKALKYLQNGQNIEILSEIEFFDLF